MATVNKINPTWVSEVKDTAWGILPTANDSSIDTALTSWRAFESLLQKSVTSGKCFTNPIASTYSLVYTGLGGAYFGAVLSPNGDIHLIPGSTAPGQKINSSTSVSSTYSLVYTSTTYTGGVLAPNGDVHFIPYSAGYGQKISITGVITTYSLLSTSAFGAYQGAVLSPDGSIHMIPWVSGVGQKVAVNGTVSTYSLAYTVNASYAGGVLAPDGTINFVPNYATVGQKVNTMAALPLGLGACLDPYINKF